MGEVKWLSEQEQEAWVTRVTANALLDRMLDQRLRPDVSMSHVRYGILARISQAPGNEMRMRALAESVAISESGSRYQMARLEKRAASSNA
jgi:DNA-binding MarR family transcriptional regulator